MVEMIAIGNYGDKDADSYKYDGINYIDVSL